MLRRSSPTKRLSLEPLEGRAVLSAIVPLAGPVEAINHGVSVLAWARVDGISSLEPSALAGAAVSRGATIADDVVVDGRIITGQSSGEMSLKGKKILQNAADAPAQGAPANRIWEYTPCCDAAQVDYFLKLQGLDGDVTDDSALSGQGWVIHGHVVTGNPAARADGTAPSATGTNYFDDRFLRADDLSGEPAVDRGGLGRDVLLGGDGDDRLLASAVSSGHIGGVNAVLGDGSVRFISNSAAGTSLATEGEAQTERPAYFPVFRSVDGESTSAPDGDSGVLRGSAVRYTGLELASSSGSSGGGMGKVQMQDSHSAGFMAFGDFTGGVSAAAADVIFGGLGQDEIDRSGAGGHELGHVLGLRHEFNPTFADAAFASLSGSESTTRSDTDNNHGTHVAGTIGATGNNSDQVLDFSAGFEFVEGARLAMEVDSSATPSATADTTIVGDDGSDSDEGFRRGYVGWVKLPDDL